jgi:hypothetical protein
MLSRKPRVDSEPFIAARKHAEAPGAMLSRKPRVDSEPFIAARKHAEALGAMDGTRRLRGS